ncbi:MAG: aminoacyl-tRNA deacylase [Caldilineaceae bacterium]|nr:aminoacyl-tRNA deacylase [Caldilineaceae bacterium]
MSDFKNNVTRFLDSKKVTYQVFTYDYDAGVHSAVDVANAVGLPAQQVFKTLVALPDDSKRKPMLVVIPGPDTLDLKALAKVTKLKKAKMAAHAEAEKLTGLQTGGISPLALINKGFDIYLDSRAKQVDKITISAGERGAQVQLAVNDLVKLTRARWLDLG